MGVEVFDSFVDNYSDVSDGEGAVFRGQHLELDARRRLEDRLEEIRLRREVQEFDFDV